MKHTKKNVMKSSVHEMANIYVQNILNIITKIFFYKLLIFKNVNLKLRLYAFFYSNSTFAS